MKLRGKKRISNKNFRLIGAIVLCTMMLIVYVSGQVYIISLERSITEISAEVEDVNDDIAHLRIEEAELKKGSRIKTFAFVNLNMKMPEGTPQRLF